MKKIGRESIMKIKTELFELEKTIGMQMFELLDKEPIHDHKQGLTLKYNKHSNEDFYTWTHLTDEALSLIANIHFDADGIVGW